MVSTVPAPHPAVENGVRLVFGLLGAADQKVDIAPPVGLQDTVDVHGRVATTLSMARGWRLAGGQFVVGNQ